MFLTERLNSAKILAIFPVFPEGFKLFTQESNLFAKILIYFFIVEKNLELFCNHVFHKR